MTGPHHLPSRPKAVSALGERTLTDLAKRARDHRRLDALVDDGLIRSRHTATDGRTMYGAAISDLMSVTEAFVVARFLDLKPTASENTVANWDKRAKAWNAHFGVPIGSHPRWPAMRGFAETRNAIQHGLGRLTERQLGKSRESTLNYIDAAGVALNGDLVVLVDGDIQRCHDTCAEIVLYLDNAAPTARC
jgi:hypothetical protein